MRLRRCTASPPIQLSVALLLCALGVGVAGAQESGRPQKLVRSCDVCHGTNGVPHDKLVPIIWGQHEGYLYLQLRDYKRGDRSHEQMIAVADQLEREDMMALAEHYSKKPWPRVSQPPASEAVALRAERANVAIGCTGCHQDQYRGEGTQPRLAGQTPEYLLRTMLETRSGVRGNNPGMTTLMRSIGEDDIAALADYLAGLVITPR
jgi:cytochrome c553